MNLYCANEKTTVDRSFKTHIPLASYAVVQISRTNPRVQRRYFYKFIFSSYSPGINKLFCVSKNEVWLVLINQQWLDQVPDCDQSRVRCEDGGMWVRRRQRDETLKMALHKPYNWEIYIYRTDARLSLSPRSRVHGQKKVSSTLVMVSSDAEAGISLQISLRQNHY